MEDWLTGTRLPIGSTVAGFVDLLDARASGAFEVISGTSPTARGCTPRSGRCSI